MLKGKIIEISATKEFERDIDINYSESNRSINKTSDKMPEEEFNLLKALTEIVNDLKAHLETL